MALILTYDSCYLDFAYANLKSLIQAEKYAFVILTVAKTNGDIMQPKAFCIIIGAMKCGTTSLFDMLATHPLIVPSKRKEPGFFSFDHAYQHGMNWYFRLWQNPKATSESIFMEASTHYTKLPKIPSGAHLMKKHLPELGEVRLIFLVRDPFKRIESQYNFDFQRGRLRSLDAPILEKEIVDTTRYMMQLKPFIEEFSSDRILVLPFDRLVDETPDVLSEVLEFLGLDTDYAFEELPQSNETMSSISLYEQMKNRDKYHKTSLLGNSFKKFLATPKRFRSIPRRKLSDSEKDEVFDLLKEDMTDFYEHFGWYPVESEYLERIADKSQKPNSEHRT